MCRKSNKNDTGAMATAKTDVFIGLQHENCYLVGGMNLWWERNKTLRRWGGGAYWGVIFPGRGMRKFLASLGDCVPPVGKTLNSS